MKNRCLICCLLQIAICIASLSGGSTPAQPLEPLDFTSLGTLNLSAGDFVIDTDALTITDVTGGGSTLLFTGVADDQNGQADYLGGDWDPIANPGQLGIPEIAVFTFSGIDLQPSASVSITGSRAIALLSQDDATIGTELSVNGAGSTPGDVMDAGPAAPGGFEGGSTNPVGIELERAAGPGGGEGGFILQPLPQGGSFGGTSLASQTFTGPPPPAHGDLNALLQGGSGGGGLISQSPLFQSGTGGGGGGAIELGARGVLTINADISANGGDGSPSVFDGNLGRVRETSASGSGGGIRIDAEQVVLNANLNARGGHAGPASSFTTPADALPSTLGGGGRVSISGSLGLGAVITIGQASLVTFDDLPQIDVSHGEFYDPQAIETGYGVNPSSFGETPNFGVITYPGPARIAGQLRRTSASC